jgi:U5 snRNP protein, DIM1 family
VCILDSCAACEGNSANVQEEDRVVVIRFGHDWEENCMQMDQVRHEGIAAIWAHMLVCTLNQQVQLVCEQILANTADMIKNFAVTYLVDISEVPDFNTMYEVRIVLGLHS